MSDDCERCGQPVASYEEVDAVLDTLTREDRARYRDIVAPLLREKFAGRCDGIATCVAVNWRTRCLSAERDRDEAVARAERAEAECGAMRAVVEAADAYVQRSGVASRRERVVVEADIERALDEWRRTRQSKEQTP